MIEHLTGHKVSRDIGSVITLLIMAITTYGFYWVADRVLGSKKPQAAPTIIGNYDTIIQSGGDLLLVPPEAIDAAIRGKFADQRVAPRYALRAISMIRPAAEEPGAKMLGAEVELTADAIAQALTAVSVQNEVQDDFVVELDDQPVVIHATDLNSNKQGWAGHLPGVWDKRLRMRLAPTIRAEEVYGRKELRADVILIKRPQLDGSSVPTLFHVMRLRS